MPLVLQDAESPVQNTESPMQEVESPVQDAESSVQGAESPVQDVSQDDVISQQHRKQHSRYNPGVIAIAGYDPATLAIWNLQVC